MCDSVACVIKRETFYPAVTWEFHSCSVCKCIVVIFVMPAFKHDLVNALIL